MGHRGNRRPPATTTAVTAVAADTAAFGWLNRGGGTASRRLPDPLLVGELGGHMPYGFHLQNSPVEMERRANSTGR